MYLTGIVTGLDLVDSGEVPIARALIPALAPAPEAPEALTPALDPMPLPPAPAPAPSPNPGASVRAGRRRRPPRLAARDLLIGLLVCHPPNEVVERGILVVRD